MQSQHNKPFLTGLSYSQATLFAKLGCRIAMAKWVQSGDYLRLVDLGSIYDLPPQDNLPTDASINLTMMRYHNDIGTLGAYTPCQQSLVIDDWVVLDTPSGRINFVCALLCAQQGYILCDHSNRNPAWLQFSDAGTPESPDVRLSIVTREFPSVYTRSDYVMRLTDIDHAFKRFEITGRVS